MPDDDRPRDEYGRPYGEPLWRGGPILGGADWREFADRRANLPRIRPVRQPEPRGEWEA